VANDADGRAMLRGSDSGPGIPAEAREKVLQRFYRLEQSRSTPGNGLGLSLAAAVMKLHSGELKLSDNNPGLTVELSIPLGEPAGDKPASR
jgi:signal transduction histidine kinase